MDGAYFIILVLSISWNLKEIKCAQLNLEDKGDLQLAGDDESRFDDNDQGNFDLSENIHYQYNVVLPDYGPQLGGAECSTHGKVVVTVCILMFIIVWIVHFLTRKG